MHTKEGVVQTSGGHYLLRSRVGNGVLHRTPARNHTNAIELTGGLSNVRCDGSYRPLTGVSRIFRGGLLVVGLVVLAALACGVFEPGEWKDGCVGQRAAMAKAMEDDPELFTPLKRGILANPEETPSAGYMQYVAEEYAERFEQIPTYLHHGYEIWYPGYGITVTVARSYEVPLRYHFKYCVEGVPVRIRQINTSAKPS